MTTERAGTAIVGGRYAWRRRHGEDALSTRSVAWDLVLERDVLVVFLSAGVLTALGGKREFLQRARRLERLEHPAIAPVTDFGVHDGKPFLVNAFFPAGSLADCLGSEPLEWRACRRIISRVAKALDHAHELGFVHGRVGPAIIVFDRRGKAALGGFPVAPELEPQPAPDPLVGWYPGLSRPPAAETDIAALAALAGRLLSGQPASASGPPDADRLARTIRVAPVPGSARAVARVISRGMSVEPPERYPTARALVRNLDAAFAGSLPIPDRQPGMHPHRLLGPRALRTVTVAAGLMLVTAAGLTRVNTDRGGDRTEPVATELASAGVGATDHRGPQAAVTVPADPTGDVASGVSPPASSLEDLPRDELACAAGRWQSFATESGTKLFPDEVACRFSFRAAICPSPPLIRSPLAAPAPGEPLDVRWEPACGATTHLVEVSTGDRDATVTRVEGTDVTHVVVGTMPANAATLVIRVTADIPEGSHKWSQELTLTTGP